MSPIKITQNKTNNFKLMVLKSWFLFEKKKNFKLYGVSKQYLTIHSLDSLESLNIKLHNINWRFWVYSLYPCCLRISLLTWSCLLQFVCWVQNEILGLRNTKKYKDTNPWLQTHNYWSFRTLKLVEFKLYDWSIIIIKHNYLCKAVQGAYGRWLATIIYY